MGSQSNVAVFIRCHKFNLKSAHLFCELEGGVGYDLFFMTDDTVGGNDYGVKNRVSFNLKSLSEFSLDTSYPQAVIHYGDMMFSIFERARPGYSYYVMLDYDVHFAYLGRAWMETFCHLLQVGQSPIDLVAPQLGPAPSSWLWHPVAATQFSEVFGSFFPVVAVSERAIRCNEARRMKEASIKRLGNEPVFCEAFLPSALHEAAYNLLDLNVLLPGSYSLPSFNFTLPAPFQPKRTAEIGRLIHPIKAMTDAPLPPDVEARVRQAEPERDYPVSTRVAFEVAAELVQKRAAYRGVLYELSKDV